MAIDKEKLLNDVSRMIDEACNDQSKQVKSINGLENHICLKHTIDNILLKETKNEALKSLCNSYLGALDAGQYDELLYESFISNASNYSYLNAVDTELSALNERIKKYKQDIDLVKILRLMEQTSSYYIVPLIEECVVTYMEDKNPNNRVMLRQALSAFQGDPYVKEINNVLNLDNSIPNNVYLGESYERANTLMHADSICSPVQYIKENESIFNVKGKYYVRKGNSITKLSKANVEALPIEFKTLCEALNSPMVTIDMNSQSIEVCDNTDFITITTNGGIRYHGQQISESDYDNMKSASFMMNEGRQHFYSTVDIIKDNIAENIAVLDFVKHVELNESAAKSVDVFKIKNNIFITTVDESLGKTTFYRNVNPIQAKNIINEHMDLNVDRLFEDVLPNQKKIMDEIDETSKQYEDYISELEEKKASLTQLQEEDGDSNSDEIAEAIKLVEDEIEKTKKDYQDYKDSVKDYTDEPEDKETDDVTSGLDTDDASAEQDDDNIDVIGTEGEDGVESEEEMSSPITDVPSEDQSDDVPEFDSILDAPTDNSFDQPAAEDDKFKIVKVSYNKNVKSGKISNKGEVLIIVPSVDVNGELIEDMKKITFYLSPDKIPVINNEYMPYDMYNAILAAIEASPETINAGESEDADGFDNVTINAEIDAEVPDVAPAEPSIQDDSDILNDIVFDPDELGEEPEQPEDQAADEIEDEPLSFENAFSDRQLDKTAKEESADGKHYPINLGISNKDVKSLNITDAVFEKVLNDRGIKFNRSNGGIMIVLNSKAEVFALKEFLMNWSDMQEDEFFKHFPELMIAESVKILGINCINESTTYTQNDEDGVMIEISIDRDLLDELQEEGFDVEEDEDNDCMVVSTTDEDSTHDLYMVLKRYADENDIYVTDNDDEIDDDNYGLVKFLSEYAEDSNDDIADSCVEDHGGVELPYDSALIDDLDDYGLYYEEFEDGDGIYVSVDTDSEYKDLVDIIRSHDLEGYSSEVEDFMSCSESFSQFMNEGMKIKITNDDTHETIEFDTDDLKNGSKEENEDEEKDNEDNVTFDADDTDLFGNDEDEEDDEEKSKDQQNESELPDEEKEEKPKKKFMFKPKSKIHESKIVSIHESAEPNVLDYVTYKGEKGQIISKYGNGDFIVNIKGSTVEAAPSEVKLVYEKRDDVKPAFKFDKNTLKAIYENAMVKCGIFMNGVQITPMDCYVNYGEYIGASNDEDVRIILEGEKTSAGKQYIKLLESLNDIVNEDDFVDGVEVASDGKALRNIKFNAAQYATAESDDDMIDVLIGANTPEVQVIQLPKMSLKSLAV